MARRRPPTPSDRSWPVHRDEFLNRIAAINVWRRGDSRAPHKPLLLLLALGRVAGGKSRLTSYGSVIEGDLKRLLKRFGRPRRTHHPAQPYARLSKDGLWEVPGLETLSAGASGIPSLRVLRGTSGGFPHSLYALLRGDPSLVEDAVQAILDAHFPPSLHEDIREAVGLHDSAYPPLADGDEWSAEDLAVREVSREVPWEVPREVPREVLREPPRSRHPVAAAPRDPRFRHRVLRAYGRRCAVCGFDVRVEEQLLGLEAAHIKWHAAGGPDTEPNGLALCSFHHKALDVGALGLAPEGGGGLAVLISSEVHGQSAAMRQLLDYRGAPLRAPQSAEQSPAPEYVTWHREEVFREPAYGRP